MGGEAKATAIIKALAEDWPGLSTKKKSQFKKLAEADQDRYDRQMRELLSFGFFVRENGSHSRNRSIEEIKAEVKTEATAKSTTKVGMKRSKEPLEQKSSTKRLKK